MTTATEKPCPDCKTGIKVWAIRNGNFVGKCATCRKMVNFGKSTDGKEAGDGKAASPAKEKAARKASPASGQRRAPAAAPARPPAPSRAGGTPTAKPRGFVDRIVAFLNGLDAE